MEGHGYGVGDGARDEGDGERRKADSNADKDWDAGTPMKELHPFCQAGAAKKLDVLSASAELPDSHRAPHVCECVGAQGGCDCASASQHAWPASVFACPLHFARLPDPFLCLTRVRA